MSDDTIQTKITEKEPTKAPVDVKTSDEQSSLDLSAFYLEPEDDDGNHEYKYKLTGLTSDELEGKITQMNFRLDEGNGEAIYELGVTDDGCPLGVNQETLDATIESIRYMAEQIDACVQIADTSESPISLKYESDRRAYAKCNQIHELTEDHVNETRYVCRLLVRRNCHDTSYVGLRVAVAGNVDAGKSTTVGVLTKGVNDDGNGKARASVFNFKHEQESGRTSSVSQEIMGFDGEGNVVNEGLGKFKAPSWPEIVKASTKIVTFYDMAGHEKYFNTTIRGISGVYPDYALIMIGANMGIPQMTREHMIICFMHKIPMIIVFTKIDMAPPKIFKGNVDKLMGMLKSPGVNKTPTMIESDRDVAHCCQKIAAGDVVPVLQISNVTGENVDLLKKLINFLPTRLNYHKQLNAPAKFTIQETFKVPGIGTVVSGMLYSGVVSAKSEMWLGPNSTGEFRKVTIRSIQDKRVDVKNAFAGNTATFALRNVKREDVHKGMVLIDGKEPKPVPVYECDAEIEIFGRHSTSIRIGYEPVMHISNIKQAAKIIKIEDVIRKERRQSKKTRAVPEYDVDGNPVLRSGDKAKVRFYFCIHRDSKWIPRPVYFEEGSQILFREGLTRGVGRVTGVSHEISDDARNACK
jgi:GTPase